MAIDREDTLKRAETRLRPGRLDGAIAAYEWVIDADAADWNAANALGDLFQRTQQADKAVAQYVRIADHRPARASGRWPSMARCCGWPPGMGTPGTGPPGSRPGRGPRSKQGSS